VNTANQHKTAPRKIKQHKNKKVNKNQADHKKKHSKKAHQQSQQS